MAKTYYFVSDLSTGDVLPESWLDQVRENLNNFIVPPACRAMRTTTQSISTSSFTAISMGAERYDNDSMHSTSSNTSRITFNTAGIYSVGGNLSFDGNTTGVRIAAIRLNGTAYIARERTAPSASSGFADLNVSCDYDFDVNDYIELVAWQDSGGALNTLASSASGTDQAAAELWAHWIGQNAV